MKYLLAIVLLLPSCATDYFGPRFFGPKGEIPPPPSISDDPLLSTLEACLAGSVQVHSVDAQGLGVSRGSGTVVGESGGNSLVLTARHMTEGDGISSWVVKLGKDNRRARCIRRGAGPLDDWAVLELEGRLGKAVPLVDSGRDGNLGYMQAVAVGYPLGWSAPTVTVGHLQSFGEGLMRFSCPIIFGNSGGGLYVLQDGKLRLYAVTVAIGVSHGQAVSHMGIGVPITSIRKQGGVR